MLLQICHLFKRAPFLEDHPAVQNFKRNMASSVTLSVIVAHNKCMSYPVPKVLWLWRSKISKIRHPLPQSGVFNSFQFHTLTTVA